MQYSAELSFFFLSKCILCFFFFFQYITYCGVLFQGADEANLFSGVLTKFGDIFLFYFLGGGGINLSGNKEQHLWSSYEEYGNFLSTKKIVTLSCYNFIS